MRVLIALAGLAFTILPTASAAATTRPITVPAPAYYRVVPGWPDGVEQEISGAGTDVAAGTIYAGDAPLAPFVRAHEVAHVLDYQSLGPGDRHFFARVMRARGPWDGGTGADGASSPREWFADYYAMIASRVDVQAGEWIADYAPQISARHLGVIGLALERFGRRHHLRPYRPPAEQVDRVTHNRDGSTSEAGTG